MELFVHPSKRYRLYFDETGHGDLRAAEKDPNQRYLSLTGLVIRQDRHDSDTTKQLNTLKTDVFGKENVILHRREIIDAKGDFAVLRDGEVRAKFNAEFCCTGRPPFEASFYRFDRQTRAPKKIQSLAIQSLPLRSDVSPRTLRLVAALFRQHTRRNG